MITKKQAIEKLKDFIFISIIQIGMISLLIVIILKLIEINKEIIKLGV